MPETIYVLTNEAMPDLVKIGKTNGEDVGAGISQLSNTSVPFPFECYFAAEVKDCSKLEQHSSWYIEQYSQASWIEVK